MLQKQEYALVLDSEGNKLAPTKVQKAWFLIRKKRAKLIQKYPMVIQLTKKVDTIKDDTTIECGIMDKRHWMDYLNGKTIFCIDKEGKPCLREVKKFCMIKNDYLESNNVPKD